MSGTLYLLQAYPPAVLALDPDDGGLRTIFRSQTGVLDGIQVHGAANAIFWTSMGAKPDKGEAFVLADGAIERSDLDGNRHAVLVGSGRVVTPKQLQLDRMASKLYWCDREGMAIARSRTDGGDLEVLLSTGHWPDDAGDALRHCVGIALDLKRRQIYWTQKGPPDGGLGRIFRMGLEMPAGATAATRADVELLAENLPEPIDLEFDHDRDQLYWTDRGDPARQGNSLNRADISPEGLTNHTVLATGLHEAIGLALDLDERRAFVSDLSGALHVLSLDSNELKLLRRLNAPITGLAFLPDRAGNAD